MRLPRFPNTPAVVILAVLVILILRAMLGDGSGQELVWALLTVGSYSIGYYLGRADGRSERGRNDE